MAWIRRVLTGAALVSACGQIDTGVDANTAGSNVGSASSTAGSGASTSGTSIDLSQAPSVPESRDCIERLLAAAGGAASGAGGSAGQASEAAGGSAANVELGQGDLTLLVVF